MGDFMSEFLSTFDGLKSNTIFCMWTGGNPMSAQRIQALWSIYNNTGCPVALINQSNLQHWVHPDYPLHPAYPYLSATHKSDYLRVYFMHHYGGGYTDIKQTTTSWPQFFQKLLLSNSYALGYQELAHGIPHVSGELGDLIRSKHAELIGLCSFIFKKNSKLTADWIKSTHDILNIKLDELLKYPAVHPQDQYGLQLTDLDTSKYPLRWAELLGEVFHPLTYQSRDKLIIDRIEPIFHNYR
jgi:hypothetical protein